MLTATCRCTTPHSSGTTSTTSIDQLLDLGADSSCRNVYGMTPGTMRAWASIRRGFGPGLYMELQLGDMPIKRGLQALPLHQDRCSGVVIWSGSNSTDVGSNQIPHVSIDLYKDSQQPHFNYKLLISSVVSRPIAFISTRSADGNSTNLAAFSYFNIVNYDPPRFVVSFTGGLTSANDTLHNISESSEYVINITSEGFLEAANATEVNVPYGVSEWDISELTPVYNCEIVNAARVVRGFDEHRGEP
ncbi:hypothetical protein EDB81DRAFT_764884 [Dactylonectria macrodidyma]|uniref:Flavin reductase like domain-containing protein n=1 Tax=Dactylonectria macrodidyma TaxID=307937 RepID=A0A9P9DVF8_9HYPO|nr:hypothetical protein EDB81DRAFT_764884 [Dactylonectria macrodidyma]